MTIHTTGCGAIALMIDAEELLRRGLSAEALGCADAAELCLMAFRAQGLEPQGSMELTLHPGARCVMLFAKLLSSAPLFYAFDSIEQLIPAAQVIASPPPSSLYWHEGHYILAVFPYEGEPAPLTLADYGTELSLPPQYLSVLREHGREVSRGHALETLREAFCGD